MLIDFDVTKTTLRNAEVEQIRTLAKQIRNSKHFKTILRDARPEMRRGVYDIIAPLLGFDVAPFDKLMRAILKRESRGKIKGKST
jgi:hypothetical protein